MSRTRATQNKPSGDLAARAAIITAVYQRMDELIPGGFQVAQLKNPDGTQGPKVHIGTCGSDCAISPACLNCPAILHNRDKKVGYTTKHLLDPLRWKTRKHAYISPEGDLFHPNIPDWLIYQVFAIVETCWNHRFLWYTKRADRLASMVSDPMFPVRVHEAGVELLGDRFLNRGGQWGNNLIIGVSVENQKYMDERAPALLELPRCLNIVLIVAPMLEPVVVPTNVKKILDWLICVGEFGSWIKGGPRPCELEWQIDLANQCPEVPFYLTKKHNINWVSPWLAGTGCREHREFPHIMTA